LNCSFIRLTCQTDWLTDSNLSESPINQGYFVFLDTARYWHGRCQLGFARDLSAGHDLNGE
jgi:hypothetical protein